MAEAELFADMAFPAASAVPARRLKARLARLLVADGEGFATRDVPRLALELDGIPGDRHHGASRPADSRVPWYPRGAPIRNSRQVSMVAADELGEVARRLAIPELRPEWIGANLVVEGVRRLTLLPAGTRLHFPGGAALAVEGENAPCRHAGASVAAALGLGGDAAAQLALAFVEAARGWRGLVGWVERAGEIIAGDEISLRVPAQRLWRG
ncbi:MOSC domain-containing protein [Bosea sp. 117]|uniref:MOSC domain-containing protein n=1 Tax=Bosea sp. 117 TaxID=1125973 RepID=UPI000493CE4F|nr:MOSC domain-containing protein [Bosea sp. 117]